MKNLLVMHVLDKWRSLLPKLIFKRPKPSQKRGYGLALLMVFLASSVLLATSMSLILSSSVVSYITNQSSTPIQGSQVQIGNAALDAAKKDILSQLGQGNTIDTTYRYPATGTNLITAPTYPGSGATNTIGSYYVTATKARGFTYILQATVTVNGITQVISRLFQLSASQCLSKNTYFSYSLRKLCSTYTGKAVNVRCAGTSTTTDIGFVGNDFDVASLRTCLGEDLPLNVDSTAKAAYSLRKLSTAYSGKAINVRRSSDNTTQDIGFNSFGNLDTKSLLTFVGTGSGYIATWYDQSGQGLNLTQGTTANQPRIVNTGVIDNKSGIPTVYFGGSQSLANAAVSGKITGSEIRSFMIADVESGSNASTYFGCLWKSGDVNAYSTTTSAQLLILNGSGGRNQAVAKFYGTSASYITITPGALFQSTTYHDASNNVELFTNGVMTTAGSVSSSLAPTSLVIGTGVTGTPDTSSNYLTGYISELVIYTSAVTSANQTKIERNQDHFYKISGYTDGFVTTWYDQSGNGFNLTQGTTGNQPTIDVSGSAPAVFLDARVCTGSTNCQYLTNSTLNNTLSPMAMTTLAVGQLSATVATSWQGALLAVYKTGTSDDRNASSASIINQMSGSPVTLGSKKDSDTSLSVSYTQGTDFQVTSMNDGTTRTFRAYQTATGQVSSTSTAVASENLVMNNIRVGINDGVNSNNLWDGRINEILFFPSALSSTKYQTYEANQRTYYGL